MATQITLQDNQEVVNKEQLNGILQLLSSTLEAYDVIDKGVPGALQGKLDMGTIIQKAMSGELQAAFNAESLAKLQAFGDAVLAYRQQLQAAISLPAPPQP